MYRIASFVGIMMLAGAAAAQNYPTKPIRMLVPYSAGGSTDVVARVVTAKMQESLGQPIVVENRPGGAEIIATDILAKSSPDGYTIALVSNTFAINETFAKKLPYDAQKDFVPIAKLVDVPFGMFITPTLPVSNVKEFVEYAKARPGKLNYAHVGLGTPHYLTMEWFKRLAGLDIVGIGYAGAVPAMTAVAQGEVQIFTSGLGGATAFYQAGKVRAIANASPQRVATLPDLPTLKEVGYSDFDFTSWFGVLAPANTPPQIVERLNAEFNKAVQSPSVKQQLERLGLVPSSMSAREFEQFVRSEAVAWGRVVKATGVKSE